MLTLTMVKRSFRCGATRTYPYVSGIVSTWHAGDPSRFQFRYSYMEARMRMPDSRGGPGYWPGFWSGAAGHTWPPELDVVEWQSKYPNLASVSYHYRCGDTNCRNGTGVDMRVDLSSHFHTYGLDWEPSGLTWYIDGSEVYRYEGSTPNTLMDLRLNLAIDSRFVTTETRFPARLQVQYVRVWQHSQPGRSDRSAHVCESCASLPVLHRWLSAQAVRSWSAIARKVNTSAPRGVLTASQ